MTRPTTHEHPTPMPLGNRSALAQRAALAAVSVAFVLIAVKAWAWQASGAVVMLGSLVDSVLDSLASLANLAALRFAYSPPDDNHRFGHGKAEALSGLVQAVIIFGSTTFLVWEAINHLRYGSEVTSGGLAISVLAFSIVLTLVLVIYQRRVARQTGSIAVDADRVHYEADLLMNLASIGAIALAGFGGPEWVDPVGGLAIAGYVGYSAWQILRAALDQLMDRELSDEERASIIQIAESHPQVRNVHELRTRGAGPRQHIQLHVVLDPSMSLAKAHGISIEVESALLKQFPTADILIHMDPDC